MARQSLTQQVTADSPPTRVRGHGQIQDLPLPFGDRSGDDEPHHRAPLFGDPALISEIIAWIPVGGFRRGRLNRRDGWKVLFGSGSNDHRFMLRKFLTAEWRSLAMLNYEVDPAVLKPHVPPGTELDSCQGVVYASMVGFLFLRTRVLGVAIPGHQNFEEVNLRFYVRHKEADGWKRGVVFLKEIVPKRAVAVLARWLYNENYVAMPMAHRLEGDRVEYSWLNAGTWSSLAVEIASEPALAASGSLEEFITEHYWGYTRQRDGSCLEYRVEHVPWRLWQTRRAQLSCDVANLY